MKQRLIFILLASLAIGCVKQSSNTTEDMNTENHYTFAPSSKVEHQKVTFTNRYGITLTADLYKPINNTEQKFPAIAVSGPFGAVKEQTSGLYAQEMAARGCLTLAFDPSYTW